MSELQQFARWQGGVDQKLEAHAGELLEQRRRLDDHGTRIGVLEVSVGKLAVKVGLGAAMGAIVGGGVVTAVATVLFQ